MRSVHDLAIFEAANKPRTTRSTSTMSDSPAGAGRADSIESHDDVGNKQQPEKKKSRRPASEWDPGDYGLVGS